MKNSFKKYIKDTEDNIKKPMTMKELFKDFRNPVTNIKEWISIFKNRNKKI